MSIRQHIDLIQEALDAKPSSTRVGNWADWAAVTEDFGAHKAPPFGKKAAKVEDTDDTDDTDQWEPDSSKQDVEEDTVFPGMEDASLMKPAISTFGRNRSYGTLQESKQRVLDELDKLLGCQICTKGEKLTALREVAAAATRMADGIASHLRQSSAL